MNIKFLRKTALLTFVLGLLSAFPATARELSLSEALELAEQHSHQLKKTRAERQAYESLLRSAGAKRMPTLSLEAIAFYNDEVASFDITLPLNRTISREIGTKDNYLTNVRLSLPLFTGGKISSGIKAAQADLDWRRALEEASLEKVLYQARLEYLSLYKAERLVEAAQASLERATIIMKDVQALFNAGTADSVDLLEADFTFNEAYLKVKEAESARRAAEIRLTTLLGLPSNESIKLTDTPPPPTGRQIFYSSPTKPELKAGLAAIARSQAQFELAQSAYLPSVATYVGYSYGKPNIDWFNKTWMDYFTVGAKLTWSLNLGRQEHYTIRQARYLHRAAQKNYDDLLERFERDAKLALEQVTLARQRYNTTKQRKRTADDNYRLALRMHKNGALSSNRLLEIETALSEAEAALAAAIVDYYIAESTLFYALGSEQLREGF
jgi:outer membrane protein TolC